jgi:hypothetical protein
VTGARHAILRAGVLASRAVLPHILELLPDQLVAHAVAHGVALRPDEARRILVDAHAPPGHARTRKPVARAKLAAVAEIVRHDALEVLERATDPADGS